MGLVQVIGKVRPDEIYNLAEHSLILAKTTLSSDLPSNSLFPLFTACSLSDQLVPQLSNSTSNNPLGEQVKSEPWWISGGVEECIDKAEEIASAGFDRAAYAARHKKWLATKIDCTAFLTWFIENYP